MRIGNRYITIREGSIAWHVKNFIGYALFIAAWTAVFFIAGILRFGWPF